MKKQLCTILALLAALGLLAGCAQAPQGAANASTTDELPQLVIGTTIDDPYYYMGENGEYIGIDKELADEACRRMGYTPVYCVFTWGEQDSLLNSGAVDCIWESFAMNGREDLYQWVGPYMTDPEMVVVAADSDIYTLDDLSDRCLAVRIDSKGEDYFLNEHGTAYMASADTVLCTFDNMTDAFSYFGKGYADAMIGHRMVLRSFTKQNPELYRYLDEPLMELKLGVAFAKDGDSALAAALQATLDEMEADGTIAAIGAAYGADDGEAGAAGGN